VSDACDPCLRRAHLLARLAPAIARSLDERRRVPALLSLSDEDLIAAVCGNRRREAEELLSGFDPERARGQAAAAGLAALCRHAAAFPRPLLEADDGPALLYLRGRDELLSLCASGPAVAIVGSRRASDYALEVAHTLARELAACGVPVVSGMAFGVDSAAHEGALAAAGPTLAVLGSGADVPYPRAKRFLYERIVESGLVVSELPPRASPFRWTFPARNRIMAGLSAMTVVVEGRNDSGSLITAHFAADLGREVGAVPGQVTSPLADGPNGLLVDGATVVRSTTDVLDVIYGPGHDVAPPDRVPERLEPRLRTLLAAVEQGRATVDALTSEIGEAGDVLGGLTELELLGLVRRSAAGRYVRCADTRREATAG
jgi:DNA processing protein